MNKNFSLHTKMAALFLFIVGILCAAKSFAYPVTPAGKKYTHFLDNLDVSNHWLPHRYVEWKTGKSVGTCDEIAATHCSTFVAATAAKLGVYILRPPDHAKLLANAQYNWLRHRSQGYGWATVSNHQMAQQIANPGCLVVIAYGNPNPHRPGHIAIVRPSAKSRAEINAHGPQIIQAGRQNFNSTTVSKAFRHHQQAFKKQKIVYYAHSTPYCRLLVQKEVRGQEKRKQI